jgi:hypothetical protein
MSIVLHGECGREYPEGTSLPPSDVCTCELWSQLALAREGLEKIANYGRPLEAPKASYAVYAINDIAKAVLAKLAETTK